MKYFYLFLSFLFIQNLSFAQSGCDGTRYVVPVFDSISVETIKYGENLDISGENQELFMDIYQPFGDTLSQRPLVILAYGGAFISGQREDMELFATGLAQRGMVAASIDYRLLEVNGLGDIPDSTDFMDIAFKAISDMKGSIREMRKIADNGNPYRIDSDMIFVGGVSAGAITALQTAYLDSTDVIPDFLVPIIAANGGLDGNTGDSLNQTYSAEVNGVINGSGALYRTDWMDEGEVPFTSYHGTEDEVVPFNFGIATIRVGIFPIMIVSLNGSGNLKIRADELNIPNILETVEGGGHADIYTDAVYASNLANFLNNSSSFLETIFCGTISSNEEFIQELNVEVYPNPVDQVININIKEESNDAHQIQLIDAMGRVIINYRTTSFENNITLENRGWAKGMYYLNIQSEKGRNITKLLVQ